MKRKLASAAAAEQHQQRKLCFAKKKLRSRAPRRRRRNISPLLYQFPAAAAVDSSDLAAFVIEEVSCDSSIASVDNHKPPPPPESLNELPRIVTRTYYRNESRKCVNSLEISENSCVESCPGENKRELLILKSAIVKESEAAAGGEVTKSEVSSISPRYSFADNFYITVNGNENSIGVARDNAVEIPGVNLISRGEITNSESEAISLVKSGLSVKSRAANFDLTCSEQFSDCRISREGVEEEEEEENSSSSAESKVQVVSDLELDDSQYTPSFWSNASGSQFSEKSIGDASCSPTSLLFSQFKQQFCRSTFASSVCADDHSSPLLGLEHEEDEESYGMMRKRERSQLYLRDYAEEYCNTTDYGELVIRQRLHMVHWIVEQATNKKLQMETMFLGVSLLDRFLSLGYFKNMKNLQTAGIACLTLATRIEENQPHNRVLTETFCVGMTTYLRCEVVAMEWLVMEVLNFKCFLPTLYNFLWYYLKAARANKKVEKMAKYLAVLALMGHQQLCFWPSIVAAGLVVLACIAANEDESCQLITAIGAREKDKSLPECVKSLEWLVKYL